MTLRQIDFEQWARVCIVCNIVQETKTILIGIYLVIGLGETSQLLSETDTVGNEKFWKGAKINKTGKWEITQGLQWCKKIEKCTVSWHTNNGSKMLQTLSSQSSNLFRF